ncbi:MAG: hypothetical protein L6R38_001889 [Xanthoria sp. 2 TBL-2021]|nr:MAG: hypothetical protein L6R38_001889 [Xanthoria sp. 2 TBL-2021]
MKTYLSGDAREIAAASRDTANPRPQSEVRRKACIGVARAVGLDKASLSLNHVAGYEKRGKDSDDAEYDRDVTATAIVSSGSINTPIEAPNDHDKRLDFNSSIEFFRVIVTNLLFKNNIPMIANMLGNGFSLEPSIPIISTEQTIHFDFTYLEDIVVPVTAPSTEAGGRSEGPHICKARSTSSIPRKKTKARKMETAEAQEGEAYRSITSTPESEAKEPREAKNFEELLVNAI